MPARRPRPPVSGPPRLMYDLAALAIFAACFLFVFALIEIFDRV